MQGIKVFMAHKSPLLAPKSLLCACYKGRVASDGRNSL